MPAKPATYQLAIIGGGLAGLSLSILAARAGCSVVLFEKEQYPLHRVCGEYISMESWPFLLQLGVPLNNWPLPRINQLAISSPGGRLYTFKLDMGGFGISRYCLDAYLYQLAKQAGVQVHTRTRVTQVEQGPNGLSIHAAGGQSWQALLCAGSYGKRSNLDVQWRRPFTQQKPGPRQQYIGVKYHIQLAHPPEQIVLHNFKHGYCGMSAVEDGTSCLCYLTTAQNLQQQGSIAAMEQAILWQNPHLKQIFTQAHFLYAQPLTIGQVSFAPKSLFENEVWMLGDAAGLIAPLCGNGMSMALHSASLAFKAMMPYLQGSMPLAAAKQTYTRAWQSQFARRLWVGRTLQGFFGHTALTAAFLRSMAGLPPLAKALIQSTHGRVY